MVECIVLRGIRLDLLTEVGLEDSLYSMPCHCGLPYRRVCVCAGSVLSARRCGALS